MRIRSQLVIFSLVVSVTYAAESLLLIGLLWMTLKKGGSSLVLGVCIFLTALVPFLLQRTSQRLTQYLAKHPERTFVVARVIGIALAGFLYAFGSTSEIHFLYFATAIFAAIDFFTIQSLDTIVSIKVLQSSLSANHAARIIQTSIQVGSLLGASASGFLMEAGGMAAVAACAAVTYAIGPLCIAPMRKLGAPQDQSQDESQSPDQVKSQGYSIHAAFGLLIVVFIHVAAFNILVPVLIQNERGWSASDYGIIDAFAGVGAFLSALLMSRKASHHPLMAFAFVGVALAWVLLSQSQSVLLVSAGAFGGGLFGNFIRVRQRELLFASLSSAEQAVDWSSRLNIASVMTQAMIPLLLGFLATDFQASDLLLTVSCVCFGLSLTCQVVQSRALSNQLEKAKVAGG